MKIHEEIKKNQRKSPSWLAEHWGQSRQTVRKEMTYKRDSERLHKLVYGFPIVVYYDELIRVVSRNPRYA